MNQHIRWPLAQPRTTENSAAAGNPVGTALRRRAVLIGGLQARLDERAAECQRLQLAQLHSKDPMAAAEKAELASIKFERTRMALCRLEAGMPYWRWQAIETERFRRDYPDVCPTKALERLSVMAIWGPHLPALEGRPEDLSR
ncbi:hypothetical protein J2X65_004291 [Ancylobacter sp. 3268]|uniref:hypothetical protein n=1 Tax=Ancylobacter sp. 3268 TaxID=2817752 RepID=UPI00285D2292|nr:hypothetical protein [Ancylobacter sp. 3268]MDR6954915.1 hypothetical protein [Ancylobacter sp. 3268]